MAPQPSGSSAFLTISVFSGDFHVTHRKVKLLAGDLRRAQFGAPIMAVLLGRRLLLKCNPPENRPFGLLGTT